MSGADIEHNVDRRVMCPFCGYRNQKITMLEKLVKINDITCIGCGMGYSSSIDHNSSPRIYDESNFIEAWGEFDRIPSLRQKEIFNDVQVHPKFLEKYADFLSRAQIQFETGDEINKIKRDERNKKARERYQRNKERKIEEAEIERESNFRRFGTRETDNERKDRMLRKAGSSKKIEEGDLVEICHGPFAGSSGRVKRINADQCSLETDFLPSNMPLNVLVEYLFKVEES